MSFASAIHQLFPVSSRLGHLFLNLPPCPAQFAATADDTRQRQNRQLRMVAIHARNISNCWLLIFHKAQSGLPWDMKRVKGKC
jgi:hypothetical protein